MKKAFAITASISALLLAVNLQAYTIGAKTSKLTPAQTEYKCVKTDENIVIDGKLNEKAWNKAEEISFQALDGFSVLKMEQQK